MFNSIALLVIGLVLVVGSIVICVRSAAAAQVEPPPGWYRFAATEGMALLLVGAIVIGGALVVQQVVSWL